MLESVMAVCASSFRISTFLPAMEQLLRSIQSSLGERFVVNVSESAAGIEWELSVVIALARKDLLPCDGMFT